jgi:translocator protein
MTAMATRRWTPVVTAAVAALSVALLGGLATELGPWYFSLRMPSWKPPDWLFGPAWTLIYGLSAMAAVSAWWNSRTKANRFRILLLFAANSLLGIAWSVLFFSLRHPDWALFEVVFLWLSIVALIVGLWPISSTASWLLAPYLLWVSFAAVLNLAVVQLNFVPR